MVNLNDDCGVNCRIYRDVVLRRTQMDDGVIVGDDSFITDCKLGYKVAIERRCMLFSSIIGDYTSVGWNSVVRNATVGKFCSFAWSCSVGGRNIL